MVYRGKPSAGCENCRRAKKRCGLEQPACQRCVKLKKICSGYRDTTQLQIQDESETVRLKAKRQRIRSTTSFDVIETGMPTPATIATSTTPVSDWTSNSGRNTDQSADDNSATSGVDNVVVQAVPSDPSVSDRGVPIPFTMKPTKDDVATTYFFAQFTAKSGHWTFLREHAGSLRRNRILDLAIRACGMAALANVQYISMGREYARVLYTSAITHLNAALRDPQACRTDESLMAVAMLGYYENLTCDSRQSVDSWRAHINGAAQLLKLRGKEQLKSPAGRMLFREIRAQIMISCVWEIKHPPTFLGQWEAELEALSPERVFVSPSDKLLTVCYHFAVLRNDMLNKRVALPLAMERASKIETDLIQWSIDTMTHNLAWRYRNIEVLDSPHVRNGVVQAVSSSPVATVWNTYRCIRIMLTRTQELICRRLELKGDDEKAQLDYFRSVRRQMADDICSAIPTQLGHASPAYNSPCIITTAYASIWPLFFATSVALERIGFDVWNEVLRVREHGVPHSGSAAFTQASWLLGRLEYISTHLGVRWADGVAATLRGDFYHISDPMPADTSLPVWLEEVGRSGKQPRILLDATDVSRPPGNRARATS